MLSHLAERSHNLIFSTKHEQKTKTVIEKNVTCFMRETGIKKLEGNDKKILEKYEILLIEIRIYIVAMRRMRIQYRGTRSLSLPLYLPSLPAHIINLQRTSYTTVPYAR